MPCYGVDCCGNDLLVPPPYRVDVASLLREKVYGQCSSVVFTSASLAVAGS